MRKFLFIALVTALAGAAGWAEGKHQKEKWTALDQCLAEKTSIVETCGKCWIQCDENKLALQK